MGSLIKSEIIKFFKNRKNRILLLILIAFLISSNVFYKVKEKNYPEYYFNERETSINIAKNRLSDIQGELELHEIDDNLTEEEVEELLIEKKKQENEYLHETMLQNIVDTKKGKMFFVEDKVEETFLPYTIKRLENIIEADEEGVIPPETLNVRKITMDEIKRRKVYYDYLNDNDIEVSINPYTNTGINSIYGLLENNMVLIMFIIFTFLTMDMFLSEVEEDSYKLLYIQPFERKRIFYSKIISMTIIVAVILLLLLGVNFIVNSIINGIGNLSYPFAASRNIKRISLNNKPKDFIVITIGKNIAMSLLLIFTVLFFNIILISFLSVYADSTTKTVGIVLILIMITLLLREFFPPDIMAQSFIPFTYIFTQDILIGKINVNYIIGIILNISLSLILLIASSQKFIRKDFLGSKE